MKFRKKPVIVEAVQYINYRSISEIKKFMEPQQLLGIVDPDGTVEQIENSILFIDTLEGEMQVRVGDWVIKGIKGEFYPCKPDIFEMTYEEITQ